MTTHRSWFPFILVGLTVFLLFVVGAFYQRDAETNNDAHIFVPTPLAYESAVANIVWTYETAPTAAAAKIAYDSLLTMRVPSIAYQNTHLNLILTFGQLSAGENVEGARRLESVKQANPWLVIP